MLNLFFPAGEWGLLHFSQICLCQNVLQLYARKLCCVLWSSTEGKGLTLLLETATFTWLKWTRWFRNMITPVEQKAWLSSNLETSLYLLFVYPQQLHMKGHIPSEIFLHYSPGDAIWIHTSSRPSCIKKMWTWYIIWVFGLLFLVLECCVCLCLSQKCHLENSFNEESKNLHTDGHFCHHRILAFFILLYACKYSHDFILHF